ncbi:MAG: hypothetical protein V3R93_05490, partial [Candidatus Hydrothermarchaeaceae archaeon]
KTGDTNPTVGFICSYLVALERDPIQFERIIEKTPRATVRTGRRLSGLAEPGRTEQMSRFRKVQDMQRELHTVRRALKIQKENFPPSVVIGEYPHRFNRNSYITTD